MPIGTRKSGQKHIPTTTMWRNYLKTAVRNLWKNRIHGLINLLGLSLGVAGSLILFLYVRYHSTFEAHVPDADRIHRLAVEFEYQGELVKGPIAMIPAIDIIRSEIPQVEASTFVDMKGGGQLSVPEGNLLNHFAIDDGIFRVDSLFFGVFPQTFLVGTAEGFTQSTQGVVISVEMAQRFFGDTDVVGRSLIYNEDEEYIVEGVITDPPRQSDLNFHVLLSAAPEQARYDAMDWGSLSSSFQFFFRLQPEVEPTVVSDHITEVIKEMSDDWDNDFFCRTQALLAIHNDSDYDSISVPIVAHSRLTELSVLSLILILLACVNFVNLATALASHRAKEVGIRKSLGSVRKQLISQFLGETSLVVLLALVFGMVLAELALIQLDPVLGIELRLFGSNPVEVALYLLITMVFVVLVSGLYPSLVMSGFQPIKALKEAPTRMTTGRFSLRKALVVFQFGVSQFMIIYTVVVIMQNKFLADRDLGLDIQAKLVVPIGGQLSDRATSFKDALDGVPGLATVALSSSSAASDNTGLNSVGFRGEGYTLEYVAADEHFMEVYGIELLAGEGLIAEDSATRCLLNEAAVRRLGMTVDEIIGETIGYNERDLLITGVVKDYHNHSLRREIDPLLLLNRPERYYTANIALSTTEYSVVLEDIRKAWHEVYPEALMDYTFQDEILAEFYANERTLAKLVTYFSLLAIFIGCLGLYGLASFMVTRKRKEIGVRKVLGASVSQILWIFSREYLVLIVMGFALAAVGAYFGVDRLFLSEFEYRISLSVWIFLSGLVITVGVALLTVGYRSLKAAIANPVKSLRYE
ncbi:MAG TPA: hypothetical protein DCR93_13610 [Cytophagales bacterium]|nr:hypothetical protein [Cytophagales bacterium]